MFKSIGFVGAGRIARIMIGGWRHAAFHLPTVLVYDAQPEAVAALRAKFPDIVPATLAEVAQADLVFGALHPPAMLEALPQLRETLNPNAVFCSLAPKIKLATLQERLGGFERLLRMNPNAPSIVGAGYNPVSFGPGLPQPVRDALLALFAPLGRNPEVEERVLESYAVISAMGPTYFGFQFAEVERLATTFGIAPDAARDAMLSMVRGTAEMLFASELQTEDALDLVPVRPLAPHEAHFSQVLRQQLEGTFAKLTT